MEKRSYAAMKDGRQVGLLVAPMTESGDFADGFELNFGADQGLADKVKASISEHYSVGRYGEGEGPWAVLTVFILPGVSEETGLTFEDVTDLT